jgi:hypothetical protein
MSRGATVGVDSQCLSYLIDALQGIENPRGPLAAEQIVLVRIFLYTRCGPAVTPMVVNETAQIRSVERSKLHLSRMGPHFI